MPFLIDEIVITIEVGAQPAGAPAPAASRGDGIDEKQELVRECVERVLEILAQREER